MIKSKKQMYIVVGAFALVLMLFTTTYAFFNYTRTGVSNTIKVGRISFNSSQNGNINLTNVFPIPSTDAETDTTNAKSVSITITGDTDYSGGVEYVVTASDVNMTVNGKQLPVSLEVTVAGNNNKTLGTLETGDYYTNRDNYSVSKYKIEYDGELEENAHILVGYIAPNTTSGTAEGVDGIITIKAYIDADRVFISDTYDGTESDNMGTTNAMVGDKLVFTTNEWNSIQSSGLSFKVKVDANEGIWVKEALTFVKAISRKNGTVNYIASYDDIIAEARTQNLTFTTQDQVSTSATKQTVYYYTGNDATANANVLFAGYCWQIIRTTDNGGVKMIYNGVAVNNKCETTRTTTKGIIGGDGTSTSFTSAILFGRSYDYDLTTGQFTIEDSTGLPTAWNDTNYPELIGTYTCKSSSATCTTLYYVGSYKSSTEAYVASYTIGNVAHFSQMGTSAYNSSYRNPALVGYMFNKEYDYKKESKLGEYYTNAVWENGAYTLSNGNSGTTPDATHHYICDDNNCTKVRFYYYVSGSSHYRILLENGKMVEDALKEMINYKTNLNDSDENINVYNSAIKGYLDNWYKKNLVEYASYVDNEIVYCNDRSVRDLGGWNPSGTNLTGALQFNQYSANRDLSCVNETDRFSKINNKAKLDYPIGVLSEPERNLMTANFAKTGQYYWGLSPSYFYYSTADVHNVDNSGDNYSSYVRASYGVRGVISLRPGTELSNGTGTYTDPYIVGPIVERSE